MIPYILLFVAIISCHLLSNLPFFDKRKTLKTILVVWVPIVILIVLSTLKSNSIGNDTQGYFDEYQNARTATIQDLNRHLRNFEIGFRYLFIAFAKTGIPFKVFQLFIYSVIYVLLGIILQKKSKYPSFSIIIFCLWSWMIFNFSALRQGLADAISFFSLFLITCKFNKKYKNILIIFVSLALFGLSITLHISSAFFGIAFVLFAIKRFVPEYFGKITILIAVTIPFIFIFAPELYQVFFYLLKSNRYIPTQRSDAVELFILYYLILIAALIFSHNNKLTNKTNEISSKLFSKISFLKDDENNNDSRKEIDDYTSLSIAIFSIGVVIQSFSYVCDVMLRAANPFLLFAIIIIPNVIYKNKSKSLRVLAQIAVIALFFVVFYLDCYRPNYLHSFPYII